MKIRLLRCVLILGTPTDPGTVVDLATVDARSLIRRGMAEPEGGEPARPATFRGVMSTESGTVPLPPEPEPAAPTPKSRKQQ
jgi:hypothetical protein